MSKEAQKDIWDVMFSLDKSCFPLSRNYLEQPRGSSNFINSQVSMEPKREYLDFAKTLSPVDLYALDFELNITFRKAADFILFCDGSDVVHFDDDNPIFFETLFPINEKVEDLIDHVGLCTHDMFWDIYSDADFRVHEGGNPSEHIGVMMRDIAELQYAVEYYIEHSDWDWRTKADAFLRSHYLNDFEYANDETLIYLCKNASKNQNEHPPSSKSYDFNDFDIQNKIYDVAKKEADSRWHEYKERWNVVGFDSKNPFKIKSDISGLRNIHCDSISFLNSLIHNPESQHLLSPNSIRDFCRLISIFRTDMRIDRERISCIYGCLKQNLSSNKYKFGYNYTAVDSQYLVYLLFHFLSGRLANISYNKQFSFTASQLFVSLETDKNFRESSTFNFNNDVALTTLQCINILAVWFSKIDGYFEYFKRTSAKIKEKQNNYGYWYDSSNTPEFTTVLALDALCIDAECSSFPLLKIKLGKAIPLSDSKDIYMEYSLETRTLTVGSQKINLTATQLELFEALANGRYQKYPVKITKRFEDARRYLMRKLRKPDLITDIITTKRMGRKSRYYELGPQVSTPGRDILWCNKIENDNELDSEASKRHLGMRQDDSDDDSYSY